MSRLIEGRFRQREQTDQEGQREPDDGMIRQREQTDGGKFQAREQTDRGKVKAKGAD